MGASDLVTPLKTWVGIPDREEWRNLSQERVHGVISNIRRLTVMVAQQDIDFKERKKHCKEKKNLTLNKQRLLFLIIFFSSAMNHENLYHVLLNFSVQYECLYFLCNFAVFTFVPWNRQMNVFTHA